MITIMTDEIALHVLAEVKFVKGRLYKSFIRDCWMDGNYQARGLYPWAASLQRIRNTLGPSWLVRAKPVGLTKDARLIGDAWLH